MGPAARCGAHRVVLTDGAADALALLEDNLRRNPTDPAEVASAALDWTGRGRGGDCKHMSRVEGKWVGTRQHGKHSPAFFCFRFQFHPLNAPTLV